MADVQARVVTGADGEVSLYLFSDEKVSGGASKRWSSITIEDGEAVLTLGTREPDGHAISAVDFRVLDKVMLSAFAHVQR